MKMMDSYNVRSGATGLWVDKKRCGLCQDVRCMLCDNEQGEFEAGRRVLLDRVKEIEGASGGKEKVLSLFGKRIEELRRVSGGW